MKYRCNLAGCRLEFSIRDTTFFANSRIPCNKILATAPIWLSKPNHGSIASTIGLEKNTATEYLSHFWQLAADSLDENEICVGGKGIIMEIGEAKLGKRKYHCDHRVEDVWIIVGVERTTGRRVFLSIVENRSAVSLLNVISKHAEQGSIIYIDLWKVYRGLTDLGFAHMTVIIR